MICAEKGKEKIDYDSESRKHKLFHTALDFSSLLTSFVRSSSMLKSSLGLTVASFIDKNCITRLLNISIELELMGQNLLC